MRTARTAGGFGRAVQGELVSVLRVVRAGEVDLTNPGTGESVPKSSEERVEMCPWSEDDLEDAYLGWRTENAHLADVFLVLAGRDCGGERHEH